MLFYDEILSCILASIGFCLHLISLVIIIKKKLALSKTRNVILLNYIVIELSRCLIYVVIIFDGRMKFIINGLDTMLVSLILMISIEKNIKITQSLNANLILTLKRVIFFLLFVIFSSIVINIPLIKFMSGDSITNVNLVLKIYIGFVLFGIFLLIGISLVFLSKRTLLNLKESSSKFQEVSFLSSNGQRRRSIIYKPESSSIQHRRASLSKLPKFNKVIFEDTSSSLDHQPTRSCKEKSIFNYLDNLRTYKKTRKKFALSITIYFLLFLPFKLVSFTFMLYPSICFAIFLPVLKLFYLLSSIFNAFLYLPLNSKSLFCYGRK